MIILNVLLTLSVLVAMATLTISVGINTSEDSNMDKFFKKSKVMDKLMTVTSISILVGCIVVILMLIAMTTELLPFIKNLSLIIGFFVFFFYVGKFISKKIEEE